MTAGIIPLSIISFAQAAARKWDCPASISLAQWALESSWGARMSGKNNPFGIKAKTGTTVATHEQTAGGQPYAIAAVFADYASVQQSFDAHGAFLSTKRYAPARAVASNPRSYARQLQACGYATDVHYADKLIAIMDAHDLYAYDVPGGFTGTIPKPFPPIIANKSKTAAASVVIAAGAGAAVAASHVVSVPIWPFFFVAVLGAGTWAYIHFKR